MSWRRDPLSLLWLETLQALMGFCFKGYYEYRMFVFYLCPAWGIHTFWTMTYIVHKSMLNKHLLGSLTTPLMFFGTLHPGSGWGHLYSLIYLSYLILLFVYFVHMNLFVFSCLAGSRVCVWYHMFSLCPCATCVPSPTIQWHADWGLG